MLRLLAYSVWQSELNKMWLIIQSTGFGTGPLFFSLLFGLGPLSLLIDYTIGALAWRPGATYFFGTKCEFCRQYRWITPNHFFFSSSSGFCLRVLIFRLIVSFGTLLKSNCLVDSSSVLLSFSQRKTTVFQIIFLVSSELERDYTWWPSSFDLHSLFILDSYMSRKPESEVKTVMIWPHERLK
jgi:hypothetical protein